VRPRSPLVERRAELARIAGTEIPFLSQIDVRVGAPHAKALGFPTEPNTVAAVGGRDVLWLGPDEWLVVSGPDTSGSLLDELEAALAGVHHSIVDVSANRAIIELTGSGRHGLMASACPIDLHPRSWRAGQCAQTMFGAVQVMLQERSDVTRVFVRPSFAGYVVHLLLAAVEL
jgi:sarcosine oxidase, subunit gamma